MTHVGLSLSFADALISCSTDFHLNLEISVLVPALMFYLSYQLPIKVIWLG